MTEWLDSSNNANCFKSIYVKGFVDVSGTFISRNPDLGIILDGDASMNSGLSVAGDVSLNDGLFVGGVSKFNNIIDGTSATTSKLVSAVDIGSASFDGGSSIEVQASTQATSATPTESDFPYFGASAAGTMVFDTNSNKLWIHNGTDWKSVTLS